MGKTQNNIEKAIAKLSKMGLNIFVSNDNIVYANATGSFTISVSGVDMLIATHHCKSVASTSKAILHAIQVKLLVADSYMKQDLAKIAHNNQ